MGSSRLVPGASLLQAPCEPQVLSVSGCAQHHGPLVVPPKVASTKWRSLSNDGSEGAVCALSRASDEAEASLALIGTWGTETIPALRSSSANTQPGVGRKYAPLGGEIKPQNGSRRTISGFAGLFCTLGSCSSPFQK
eukprot:gnl/MRDRNA2_/MRDRNA2_135746_c0_seq1.p1 gnl/MRDRNA2_/MRDRNA2_135746_c0~~gnl/MRDRNA2_/MRDRNA2_135746_c0_seq1.p1  ORF type:complete len:137 (-),score=11.00 gnl/MRDRNA2_/MRDRNA2_135746_c0_seq1:30-440(-)